jgi:hypothetical protein
LSQRDQVWRDYYAIKVGIFSPNSQDLDIHPGRNLGESLLNQLQIGHFFQLALLMQSRLELSQSGK